MEKLPAGSFDVDQLPTVEHARFETANPQARFERGEILGELPRPRISEQDYADLKTAWEVAEANLKMNGLRRAGMTRPEAVIQANRLRPILMTTLAPVAGMPPLALGNGLGGEERHSLATEVIRGQSLCLLLTLLVTSVAHILFDDLSLWLLRRKAV